MTVTLMFAIITASCINNTQEVDAIAFKTHQQCEKVLPAIKAEVLKSACKVELACVERKLYEDK